MLRDPHGEKQRSEQPVTEYKSNYDVTIVGLGPIGAVLANFLGSYGLIIPIQLEFVKGPNLGGYY